MMHVNANTPTRDSNGLNVEEYVCVCVCKKVNIRLCTSLCDSKLL